MKGQRVGTYVYDKQKLMLKKAVVA